MKKLLIAIFASVLVLTACQNTEELVDNSIRETHMESTNPHRVTLAKALKTADAILGQISERPRTRVCRMVKSVDVMTNKLTRSTNDIDTAVYLVNYTDGGFAMLGADDRLPSLFAISEEGALEWSDFEENEGLSLYMDYMTNAIASAPDFDPIEETGTNVIVPPSDPEPDFPYLYQKCSPLLSKNVRKWSQFSPYNKYCPAKPDNSGDTCVVGCVPLSCAMYLSYFQRPLSIKSEQFGSISLSWRNMLKENGNDVLYKLLKILGEKQYTNVSYINKGTFNHNVNEVVYTLDSLGYDINQNRKLFFAFNQDAVIEMLGTTYKYIGNNSYYTPKPNGPVLIRGDWKDENGNIDPYSGHMWILDGYIINKVANYGWYRDYETLLHCVWGSPNGRSNGYFNWQLENGFKGKPVEYDPTDDIVTDKPKSTAFNINLLIFGDAKPNY